MRYIFAQEDRQTTRNQNEGWNAQHLPRIIGDGIPANAHTRDHEENWDEHGIKHHVEAVL